MGQQPSRTCRKRSLSRTLSLKDRSFHKYTKSRSKTLSAAFNILDDDLNWDLLNINTATEEELMTLPGVNRVVAHNVVQYRQTIGGFKKVEDLALVSGVGASKLEQFRSEITVNPKRKNGESKSPSENESVESFPNSETGSFRHCSGKLLNVNTTNVFQLMTVRGIGQELAANIIENREKKGDYNTLNDLLKVKGMTSAKFSTIRTHLSVEMVKPGKLKTCSMRNGVETRTNHRRTKSAPANPVPPQPNDTFFQEVFSILSRKSHRPIIEDVFKNMRKDQAALRIGTWNLEQFSLEKSKNPGVQEVVCRTILENGLSLVGIQEVSCPEALNSIVCELNEPLLPKTTSWEEERGHWHFWLPPANSQEGQSKKVFSGFLYNSLYGLQLNHASVLCELNDSVQVAHFQIGNFEFLLVISYLLKMADSSIHSVVNILKEKFPENSVLIVFENVKVDTSTKGFIPTELPGFKEIIPYGTATVSNSKSQCTRIWISRDVEELFTGHWGLVRDGLHHLAIPAGWTWGGSASSHFPTWLELFTRTPVSSEESTPTTEHLLQNGRPQQPAPA